MKYIVISNIGFEHGQIITADNKTDAAQCYVNHNIKPQDAGNPVYVYELNDPVVFKVTGTFVVEEQ